MATTTITAQADAGAAIELTSVSGVTESGVGKTTPTDDAHHDEQHQQHQQQAANRSLDFATHLKLVSCGFSFFVAGVNDGSIGALLPYIIRQYDISTAIVSSVYGANFLGWLFCAVVNTHLCQYLPVGSMLALGALLQVLAHALRAWQAPFGLFVASFWIVSVGQAFQDTHGNTVAAGVRGGGKAHRWLAFIHAMFMAGCLVGPFVATGIASSSARGGGADRSMWYLFYTFPLGLGVANLVLCLVAFRDSIGIKRRGETPPTTTTPAGQDQDEAAGGREGSPRVEGARSLIAATLRTKSVWLLSMFFFFYIGTVLTASGWVVEYLVDVRNGDLSVMGYVPAGFNGGALLGRVLLAEPTHRFGERRMVLGYIVASLALQLVFWLVPNIIAASVAVSLIGFFTGPLFATGMSLGARLFPREIYGTALGLVFVFAQMGGALFAIATGLISAAVGVKALQPILVGTLVATGISWLLIPRTDKGTATAVHQE